MLPSRNAYMLKKQLVRLRLNSIRAIYIDEFTGFFLCNKSQTSGRRAFF